MRIVLGTLVLITLTFSFAPPVSAGTCWSNGDLYAASNCCADSGTTTISAPDGSAFYVNTRGNGKAGPVWIYQETNSVTGLQRGGLDSVGEAQVGRNGVGLPTVSQNVGSPVGAVGGGQDVDQKIMLGQGSITPTGVLYLRATAPTYVVDGGHVSVGGGAATFVLAHVWGRYDGCFDSPPAQAADANLI